MNKLAKMFKLSFLIALFFLFLIQFNHVSANVLYSQLDDSVQLSGNSFSGAGSTFTDATGYLKEVRISYNDNGNGPGHFIAVGIVDADIGITYYGFNPQVSASCGNTFESEGLNEKQVLTFDTAWEWRAYPCDGPNLTFNPTHHYYLVSFCNAGCFSPYFYYGSSSDSSSYYGYIENSTNPADSLKVITAFNFPGLTNGTIDEVNHIITLSIPFGTDVSALVPDISVSEGASLSPNSGVAHNFENFTTYTVTAVDGSIQEYSVRILFNCNVNCISNVLYDQPDDSVAINQSTIASFPLFTGASGRISNLKFAFNDHGQNGLFMGVSVVDLTAGVNYYSSLNGHCGDAYKSTGANAKVIVNLDTSTTYKEYPCTGPNLELDPTHTYGVALFNNHGGNDSHTFYGSSDSTSDIYLHIESQSSSSPTVCTENCFSNILFLPGVMGSRLYDSLENELWVSSFDSDHIGLALDNFGKSISNSIHTKDDTQNSGENETGIVDEIFGNNIYNSFIDELRKWKEEDQIIENYAFIPYDWRLSLEDIITNGSSASGNLSYTNSQNFSESFILKKLEELQASSKSGKVTIIAHSNGGLVVKALIQKLKDTDNPLYEKIDKIIFVGVPQVGTPDALVALLHGTELGHGFIMDKDRLRQLSENMPAIYNLLPSTSYFTAVDTSLAVDKLVSFENIPFFNPQTSQYGLFISNATELKNYVLGTDGRTKPSFSDTVHPNIGNLNLYNQAENMHQILDTWQPHPDTKVVQVAGWGEETIAGINYTTKKDVTETISYKPRVVIDGDGTVVVPSALWMSDSNPNVERWWVDLPSYDTLSNLERVHKDILEIPNLQNFIKSQIRNYIFNDPSDIVLDNDSTLVSNNTRLHYTLHSPLTLGVMDSQGRYTGQDPITKEIKEEILGVNYRQIGEVQFISIPSNITHTLKLQGYQFGSFDLDVDEQQGNIITDFTSFEQVPASPSTLATIDIDTNSNIEDLVLEIDNNGDGNVDKNMEATPGGTTIYDIVTPELYVTFNIPNKDVIFSAKDNVDANPSLIAGTTSVTLRDSSDNTTVIPFKKLKESPTRFRFIYNQIIRNEIATLLPNTNIIYNWKEKDGILTDLDTRVIIRGVEKYIFNYKKANNVTIIKEKKNSGIVTTTKPGFVVVNIQTEGGTLKVDY